MQGGMYFSILLFIVALVSAIITPPEEYSVEPYFKMAERQREFIIDAFELPDAKLNPSIVREPNAPNLLLLVISICSLTRLFKSFPLSIRSHSIFF